MIRSRHGSSAVFLTIILSALFAITITLVYAARAENLFSRADAVFNLAGQSVLSEYNTEIQEEYDLFLIKGDDRDLTRKFSSYAGYSLDPMKDLRFSDCQLNTSRFSVVNTEGIKAQILESYKYWSAKEMTEQKKTINEMEEHTLRHGPTIDSLPSRQVPDSDIITRLEKMGDVVHLKNYPFNKLSDEYKINGFISKHFNSDTNEENSEHFFRNEVEYILSGKKSDKENVSKTDKMLMTIFIAVNLKHIYTSPDKTAAIETAAQTITPGVVGVATQAGIALAWATAESNNDVKLLHEGYKVPLNKGEASWATDLDGVLDGRKGKYIKPPVNKGFKYDTYLGMLLYLEDENTKMARVLDLIQINMRKNYDDKFLICEWAAGVECNAVVNGKKFSYDEIY